jgi:hypothetical protein
LKVIPSQLLWMFSDKMYRKKSKTILYKFTFISWSSNLKSFFSFFDGSNLHYPLYWLFAWVSKPKKYLKLKCPSKILSLWQHNYSVGFNNLLQYLLSATPAVVCELNNSFPKKVSRYGQNLSQKVNMLTLTLLTDEYFR